MLYSHKPTKKPETQILTPDPARSPIFWKLDSPKKAEVETRPNAKPEKFEPEHALYKGEVFVTLHSPGLFYDEIKSISVEGKIIKVDPINFYEKPSTKFEGNLIEADVNYEVIKALSTKEEPCIDDLEYNKDDCLLNETNEELMVKNGCTTPFTYYGDGREIAFLLPALCVSK